MSITRTAIDSALYETNKTGELMPIGEGWYVRRMTNVGTLYHFVAWNDGHGICKHFLIAGCTTMAAINAAAYEMHEWLTKTLWPSSPDELISEWYMRTCPHDEEGRWLSDVTFYQYLCEVSRSKSFYTCGVDDSIVRQRIQAALDAVMGCKDSYIYDLA